MCGDQEKIEESSPDAGVSCASMLKVIADETRLAVVRKLFSGPQHVSDLLESIPVEQSLLSHHLKQLRDAGIVKSERDGKSVKYSLTSGVESRREGNSINFQCCQLSFPPESE